MPPNDNSPSSSDDEEYTFDDSSPPKKKKGPAVNSNNKSSKKGEKRQESVLDADGGGDEYDDDDDDDDDAPLLSLSKKNGAKPKKPSTDAVKSTRPAEKKKPAKKLKREDAWSDRDSDDDDDAGDSDYDRKPKASKKQRPVQEGAKKRKKEDLSPSPSPLKTASSASAKAKKVKKENGGGSLTPSPAPANGNKKKKIKKAAAAPASSPSPSAAGGRTGSAGGNKALKKLDKAERLQFAMQSFLWWEAPEPPAGCQWSQMEHAGVSFPEPYQPHRVPLLYEGKPLALTPLQEEAATFFAAMDPDGMHLGNPKTAKIFINNWFADFKAVLGKGHAVRDFAKLDFTPIRAHLNEQKLVRKAVTDEQRKLNKGERDATLFKFGYAIVDGHLERVGNFNMEPPGAFRGRGEHPKMGKLKQRVVPEQVSLNVSECAAVPVCSAPGHAWGDVRHDPKGQWLATWKENINNQSKYMQLAAQSSFKGKSDYKKYGKAALLCKHIAGIRKSCKKDLKSKDRETQQLATAVWVIDRLALRVGGEKDTEEEADTVGCCSLRVEHLHFDPNGEGGDNREIELEFLGKDSMLFKQTIDFGAALYNDNDGMGLQVYDNFRAFCKKKKPGEEVFDSINPTLLNNHLKQFMDGLSAKVFRTYNASKTLQDELRQQEGTLAWKSLSVAEKVVQYNNANRQVAILCNHQRSVSKAQETQLGNIAGKLETLKKQKKQLKKILKHLTSGADKDQVPLRKSQEKMAEDVQKALDKAKRMKEQAKTNADKIKATEQDEKARQMKRDLAEHKFNKAHLWERIPTIDQVNKRIEQWTAKIAKMELDLKHKDDNKEVSLGTSKINYMDPRISVAFCKRNDVPIEKVFSKTLRDKFNWAMAVPPGWEFNASVGQE